MTSVFNIIYPPSSRIGFDGGLNNKFDRALLPDNESADCLNVVYGNGSVETRGGTTKLNTATIGSFAFDGFYVRHTSDGAESMTAWADGTLHVLSGTSLISIPSAVSVYTAGVRVTATEYEDYIFYGNGGSIPYKYNGAFTRHGVYPGTTTMTVATAATGSVLTGEYIYKYTYVNTNLVESDVGPVTPTFTAAGENIALTDIPLAPVSFGVNTRRLYRSETSGTTLKLLATISDNTTTTYDDGIADASLGSAAPTDQGVPPNYSVAITHQSRLFFIDPATNFVKYTEIGNPYVVKATSFRRIGDKTGDIPQGLEIFDNSIVVGCRKSMWVIYMPSADPTDWQDIRVKTSLGTRSPFGMFRFNNRVMFAATTDENFVGYAAIAGQTTEATSTLLTIQASGSEFISDKIEPDMFKVQEAYVKNISATVFKRTAYISLTQGAGELTNNKVWVLDSSIENLSKSQKFTWAPWDGIAAAQLAIYDDKIYFADASGNGYVHEANTDTYNDNGVAIDSYYWTKEFSGRKGHENYTKDWRFANLLYEQPGDYYMNMNVRLDSDSGDGNISQVDLNPGGALWGTATWGDDLWGGGADEMDKKIFLGQLTGKRIQFKFSNQATADQKFKLIGLTLTYNLKGQR